MKPKTPFDLAVAATHNAAMERSVDMLIADPKFIERLTKGHAYDLLNFYVRMMLAEHKIPINTKQFEWEQLPEEIKEGCREEERNALRKAAGMKVKKA